MRSNENPITLMDQNKPCKRDACKSHFTSPSKTVQKQNQGLLTTCLIDELK